jgi:thiamine-phosphate pyrophosphorylase
VHFFHELINKFELKGVHFQEQKRLDSIEILRDFCADIKALDKTISSSFHELKELIDCEFEFDYHLLSPVFSSISKKGYEGRGFNVNHIDKVIIGMGGINASTLTSASDLGFRGVGVLGAVWNTENSIASFIELKNNYSIIKR